MSTLFSDAQLHVRFVTKQEQFAVPDSPYDIQSNVQSLELNSFVNALLKKTTPTNKKGIEFVFLVCGELLCSSLSEHMQKKGISTEDTIEIEYFEKFQAPTLQDCLMHDDWVSAMYTHNNCETAANTNKRRVRKPLNSQVKEILCNLNCYFKDINDKDMSSVTTSTQLVSTSTGIPLSTVKRVLLEGKRVLESGSKFKSPKKTRCRKKIIIIDDFDKAVIRRTIYNFEITFKEGPTMQRIHEKLKTEINYPGSIWSLRKEVSLLGFKWKKTEDHRKILMEKHDIRYLRIHFLTKIAEYRIQGRPVVYTDETYIDNTDTTSKSYSDVSPSGSKKAISKENRLIIFHAGGEDGFIPNALLMFEANPKSSDYHKNMNVENYTKWLQMQLVPNLKANSVVVVDSGSYHNSLENPAPNSNSPSQDMIDWLNCRNIDHSTSMLKPQLYQLILQNKQRFIEYKIDTLLGEHGHSVLRLPPYHPEINPIKSIWAMIKDYVAKKNVSSNMDKINRLAKEKVGTISKQVWKDFCDQAIKEEKMFYDHDVVLDNITERFVINTKDTSDESDNENDEDAMSGVEELL